jgi:hypothetical protein
MVRPKCAATDGGASDEACRRNCKLLVPSLRIRDADCRGAESAAEAGCGSACPERFGRPLARRAARIGDDEGFPEIDRTKRLQYACMPLSSAGALHQTGDADS